MSMFKKIFKLTLANIATIYLILLIKTIIINGLKITNENILVIVSVMTYLIGYVILFRALKLNYRSLLIKLNLRSIIITLLIAISYVLLINVLIGIFLNVLPGESLYGLISPNTLPTGIYAGITVFIITVFIAPIFEELIYREIMLSILLNKYSKYKATLIQALAFGIFHLDIKQGIYAFIFAVISGCLYIKTKNIRTCILLHSSINLINFLGILIFIQR